MELIAQNIAGGPQRAAKAVSLAQQPRLAIGAAVAEFRKMQRYQRQMTEPGLQLRDAAVVRPPNAQRAVAPDQRVRFRQKSLCRHDDRNAVRNRRVIGNADITVLDDLAVLNEWHRRAP